MKYKIVMPFVALFFVHNSIAAIPNSIGAIEFGDKNTLFVADPEGGQIIAYTLESEEPATESASYNLLDFGHAVAKSLDVGDRDVVYHDIATHPVSGEIWISLTTISNGKSQPVILRTDSTGQLNVVDLSELS